MGNLSDGNIKKHTGWNPLLRLVMGKFYRDLNELIKETKARSILDVGCGEGFVTNSIKMSNKNARIEGIDIDQDKINYARKNFPKIKFTLGSIYSIPKPNSSYELVVATEVLEHLKDPVSAIDEMKRVSSKYLLISVPRQPYFRIANLLRLKHLTRLGEHPGHLHSWSENESVNFLSRFVKIKKVETSTFWTLVLCEK
jgi:ubiquinone/menaquinone biosynthesis C-methylase UbiE